LQRGPNLLHGHKWLKVLHSRRQNVLRQHLLQRRSNLLRWHRLLRGRSPLRKRTLFGVFWCLTDGPTQPKRHKRSGGLTPCARRGGAGFEQASGSLAEIPCRPIVTNWSDGDWTRILNGDAPW
jgi:hypothetical protein